jgi:hypothetical protein
VCFVACKAKDAPPSVEADVWTLSQQLGQGLLQASAGQPEKAKGPFAKATELSTRLAGAAPKALPDAGPTPAKTDLASNYDGYLRGSGIILRATIAEKLGERRAALFELGMRLQIVAAEIADSQEGGGPETAPDRRGPLNAMAYGDPLRDLASAAGVPADTMKPVLAKIASGAPARDLQADVNKLLEEITKLVADGKLAAPAAM